MTAGERRGGREEEGGEWEKGIGNLWCGIGVYWRDPLESVMVAGLLG